MPEISITDNKGRDAAVMAESVRVPVRVRWIDDSGRQANTARILKSTIDRDYAALAELVGSPEKIADALVAGDPEIDIEIKIFFAGGASVYCVAADVFQAARASAFGILIGKSGVDARI